MRLLGELQFIANSTRSDIFYAVNKLATYTTNQSLQHYGALKWILWYLAGMKTLGITYRKAQDNTGDNNLFHEYADAAYANADDLKSTSGNVSWQQGEQLHGNWENKLLLHYPQQKQNMSHFPKLDMRHAGSGAYMLNLDSSRNSLPQFMVTIKDL